MGVLPLFLAFYAVLFAAFGVASPFLPGLLQDHGLDASRIGVVLAAGTAMRLLAGPFGGSLADRTGRARLVLAGFAACSAAIALLYAPARGLLLLTAVSVAHAAVLAPLTPVADALALGAADRGPRFRYGWVRGAGSAAFVVGTLLAGRMIDGLGVGVIVWLNAGLLAGAAVAALALPRGTGCSGPAADADGSIVSLMRIPSFVQLMLVVALIGGSHAMHDGFEVIRWRTAGLSGVQVSVLWASSVAAEVFVFTLAGPRLLDRIGPARALALAAAAGVLRWGAAAWTAAFPVMLGVEPLHGLTFAIAHLACVSTIVTIVPPSLAARAQAFYATVALGATVALVTLASGPLYQLLGAPAFLAMAGLCACAIPLALGLRIVSATSAASPLPAALQRRSSAN
ncbi:MAG: MFS transporter [Acetobacteraceae bacterium]|nr:MFS transporter [Acetobacteraceae bacterium]